MKKSRFRIITLLIALSLAALAVLQAFSLWRMYSDMNLRFAQTVTSAMERSAYEELASRVTPSVTARSGMPEPVNPDNIESVSVFKESIGQARMDIKTVMDDDESIEAASAALRKEVVRILNDVRELSPEEKEETADSVSKVFVSGFSTVAGAADSLLGVFAESRLLDSLRYINMQKDTVMTYSDNGRDTTTLIINYRPSARKPSNVTIASTYYVNTSLDEPQFHKYDSLLASNLMRAGVYDPYHISLTGSSEEKLLYESGEKAENGILFEMPIGVGGRDVVRVEIPNPNRGLLKEMSWIITSSVLILLLLCFTFIYLLRTLFRQKSIEEMRMDFTHNITHELKTPIAVAYAANDAMLNFAADSDPGRREEYLKIVRVQLESLSGMVERILSISLEEDSRIRLEVTELSLDTLLGELLRTYELKSGKRFTAALSVEPEGLTVRADKFHLGNILGNLIDNAVKYSGDDVRIDIKAVRENGNVVITVADNGIGIPGSAQERIFEKYYRVPTGNIHNVKGSGLGLYYARLVVQGHGGTISVRSREGRGTTFTIKLPCDDR